MVVLPLRPQRPKPDAHSDLGMSESRLLAHWCHAMEDRHILYFHILHGEFFHYGLPDIIACSNGVLWMIELKSLAGDLSPSQERWKRELQAAGINYTVHTPRQWVSGESLRLIDSMAEDADVVNLRAA